MKPILFDSNATTFTNYGLGVLGDVISCIVTEERNGTYELEMEYPIDGIHYEDIKHSCIIYAKPSDGASNQPFRIYRISKPIAGIVTINAEHISYQLNKIPCGPFTASNVSSALQGLKTHALEQCPFTFWTDKSTQANYKQDTPAGIRERLGGVEGSILDTYGGEFEWDGYTVKLHNSRGADRGVVLKYGKNITDINQEENIENTITGVVGFWYQEGTLVQAPAVYTENADLYPYKRTIVQDFTAEFETVPTVEQLTAKAQSYIAGMGVPAVSINVSFVPLWQTEEYKYVANLERVKLCDTITVEFEKLQIQAKAKVIRTEYDVLRDRYISIEVGDSRTDLSTQIATMNQEIKRSGSMMQQAIDSATNLITGGLGGYVVMKRNANGKPEEILIMDTEDVQTAVNVIRMNKNGIGFSTTGYNGPFTTAWTIDGSFVADFITAGTLRAIDINGVNITGSTFTSKSANQDTTLTIGGGVVQANTTDGSYTGFSVKNTNTNQRALMSVTSSYATMQCVDDTNGSYGFIAPVEIHTKDGSGNHARLRPTDIWLYDGSTNYFYAKQDGAYCKPNFTVGGQVNANTLYITVDALVHHNLQVDNTIGTVNLTVTGTKSRVSKTKNYGERLLYCYETPTPYFGDLGEGKTDESGKCYIFLDDILDESIEGKYQVFLQAYGDGRLYVSERTASYFVVEGEPNTAFGWELKAPQRGYSLHRLEPFEHEEPIEDKTLEETYQYLKSQLYEVE